MSPKHSRRVGEHPSPLLDGPKRKRKPMSDRRYYVTLITVLLTVITLAGIAANLIITLETK